MKFKNLLATLAAGMLMVSGIQAQSLKPGTVTFKNIHGSVVSHNINTGATEEITVESLLTEGVITSYSIHYTKLYESLLAVSRMLERLVV